MRILMDQNLNVQVFLSETNQSLIQHEAAITDIYGGEMTGEIPGDVTGTGAKDPLLSSWPFVIGITVVTLAVSIGVGILLAKRKIKKGFELYED
ncbi:hypothetical protein acsn021_07070 [Anaerocolumna cellulosilytica]|uniref:Uncharacterized protein n=1 Tax=Anaerocolumna cellulosilytica TaxID=433286 RepID=A0A6S6R285_9FIRM|nr:hypothetical protein [Anaerocolumna cellulosilytica]MBB5197976.1 hypothetical protein [Anaerocolumna cellulosilytica]BCJ93138.1 hypothetical protein acsn021_07070 [Anaerocolumna cellulosilytica]